MSETTKPTPANPTRVVGIMAAPADGYTCRGVATDANEVPAARRRPDLTFTYRPALPARVMDFQAQTHAGKTGLDRLAGLCDLIDEHLISWAGLYRQTAAGPVPIPFTKGTHAAPGILADPTVQLALGTSYLHQLANWICGYEGHAWEADAKN